MVTSLWKKEVYWWCHLFFLMISSTKWFLTNKLYNSHVSQSITSLIIIISWWVLLTRFQLYVMSGTWDTRGEAYMFLNWNYCYLSHSVLLLSWSNSNDKKHKKRYHTKTMTAQNLMKWVTKTVSYYHKTVSHVSFRVNPHSIVHPLQEIFHMHVA